MNEKKTLSELWKEKDPDLTELSTDKLKPLGGQVVILVDKLEDKSAGGIWLSEDRRDIDYLFGTVVAVGPGKVAPKTGVRCEMDVKPGDKVIFGRYAGADFEFEGQKYRIMPEIHVYAVVLEGDIVEGAG